jgi:hypothetical protein
MMLRIRLATETIEPVSGETTKEAVTPSRRESRVIRTNL